MGLKKRNKSSAEFSMASLTDIIFLLLIFFMLTSTLVKLPDIELPKSGSKTVAPTSVMVAITRDGRFSIGDSAVAAEALEAVLVPKIAQEAKGKPDYTVTILAETGTPFDKVVRVMQIAGKLRVRAILATQPIE
ncbi:MAG: ExbD/TolR family protein [Saprospiraceae bacterium]|jgi:biopolymer transport protein ExbD